MRTTEYSCLSTDELLRHVEFSDSPTSLEVELAQRLGLVEMAFEDLRHELYDTQDAA